MVTRTICVVRLCWSWWANERNEVGVVRTNRVVVWWWLWGLPISMTQASSKSFIFRRFWVFVRLLILLMAEIRPGCGFNCFFLSSFFLKIDRNYALDMLSLCCSVGWLNRQLKICFFQPKTSSLQRWVVVYVICNYVYTKVTHRIHVW